MNYTDLLILLMQSIADSCSGPCFDIKAAATPEPAQVEQKQDYVPTVVAPVSAKKPCMATHYGKQVPCAEVEKDTENLIKRMQKFNDEVSR